MPLPRPIDALDDCRRKCFTEYEAALKNAMDKFNATVQACKDAFTTAVRNCSTDPDPLTCKQRASDLYNECLRMAAQVLSNDVEGARLTLENCLTMCAMNNPR